MMKMRFGKKSKKKETAKEDAPAAAAADVADEGSVQNVGKESFSVSGDVTPVESSPRCTFHAQPSLDIPPESGDVTPSVQGDQADAPGGEKKKKGFFGKKLLGGKKSKQKGLDKASHTSSMTPSASATLIQEADSGLEEEVIRLRRIVQNKEDEVRNLEDMLDVKDITLKQLEEQIRNQDKVSRDASLMVAAAGDTKLAEEMDELNRKNMSLRNEIVGLTTELATAKETGEKAKRQLDEEVIRSKQNILILEEKIEKQNDDLITKDVALQASESKNEQISNQLNVLRKEKDSLLEGMSALRDSTEMDNRSVIEDSLNEQMSKYRDMLSQEQERTASLTSKLSENQRELMDLRHRGASTEAREEQILLTQQKVSDEQRQTRDKIETLERELRVSLEKTRQAEADAHRLKLEVESNVQANAFLKTQMRAADEIKPPVQDKSIEMGLRRDIAELQGIKDLQTSQIQSHADKEKRLYEEIQKLTSQQTAAVLAQSLAEEKCTTLEVRSTSLQKQLDELKQNFERLSADATREASQQVSQSSSQLSSLRQKVEDTEREKNSVQKNLTALKNQVEDTEREKNSVQKNLTALKNQLAESEQSKTLLNSRICEIEARQAEVLRSMEQRVADANGRNDNLMDTIQRQAELIDNHQKRAVNQAEEQARVVADRSVALPTIAPASDGYSDIPSAFEAQLLSNVIVTSSHLPNKVSIKDSNGSVDVFEIVCILKSRLLSTLFSITTFGEGQEARRKALRNLLGPLYEGVDWKTKPYSKLEVCKVLNRVKTLWELSEDTRLGMVQLDPILSRNFKETETSSADWTATLDTLRGSAQAIEERNREVETLCHSYSFAAQEARALAQMEQHRAKMSAAALKKYIRKSDDSVIVAEERDQLLREVKRLRDAMQMTVEENRKIQRKYTKSLQTSMKCNPKNFNQDGDRDQRKSDVDYPGGAFKEESGKTHDHMWRPTPLPLSASRKSSGSQRGFNSSTRGTVSPAPVALTTSPRVYTQFKTAPRSNENLYYSSDAPAFGEPGYSGQRPIPTATILATPMTTQMGKLQPTHQVPIIRPSPLIGP